MKAMKAMKAQQAITDVRTAISETLNVQKEANTAKQQFVTLTELIETDPAWKFIQKEETTKDLRATHQKLEDWTKDERWTKANLLGKIEFIKWVKTLTPAQAIKAAKSCETVTKITKKLKIEVGYIRDHKEMRDKRVSEG